MTSNTERARSLRDTVDFAGVLAGDAKRLCRSLAQHKRSVADNRELHGVLHRLESVLESFHYGMSQAQANLSDRTRQIIWSDDKPL